MPGRGQRPGRWIGSGHSAATDLLTVGGVVVGAQEVVDRCGRIGWDVTDIESGLGRERGDLLMRLSDKGGVLNTCIVQRCGSRS